jgi:hypothetical protein
MKRVRLYKVFLNDYTPYEIYWCLRAGYYKEVIK